MNTHRNHQRSMIFQAPACLDALEARINSNVTSFRDGRFWIVEANCTAVRGAGRTVEEACAAFIRNMGLAD
jgi:hypothetical protein